MSDTQINVIVAWADLIVSWALYILRWYVLPVAMSIVVSYLLVKAVGYLLGRLRRRRGK